MAEINDGGPAFPLSKDAALDPVTDMSGADISSGMSLRDWFAGQAMAGWLACYAPGDAVKAPGVARFAYEIADAMLAARTKGGAS